MGNELPSTLYIQVDNCWRENKNKFVLSFCELLVKSNIFKEVHLSFLYVGHTHEDVDAAFSRISEKLRVTDVSTLDELIKLLPGAEQLNNMYDVKSWLEPCISQCSQQTQPLHYKFSSQADRFITYYKGNRNEQWISLEGNFLNSIPKGQPKPLRPDFKGIDTQKGMKQINLLKHLFKNSEDSYNWWETFYKKLEKSSKSSHQWILPKLPKQAKLTVDTEAEPLPEVLQTMLNKEVRTPEVRIRKRQQRSNTGNERKPPKKTPGKKKTAKSTSKQQRRISIVRRCTIVLYPAILNDKKHIWLIIFWTLLQNISQLCCVFMLLVTDWFCALLLAGYLQLAIQLIILLWFQILHLHIGMYSASACVYLVDFWPTNEQAPILAYNI